MRQPEQPPEENTQLAADIAEFWVFDKNFREAIDTDANSQIGDQRTEILAKVDLILSENSPKTLDKLSGFITQLPGKSQVRKALLAFINSKKAPTPNHTTPRPAPRSGYLPEGAFQLKSAAKRAKDNGNHQEALKLILQAYNGFRDARTN